MTLAVSLKKLFKILLNHYGLQHWWPAETPFEVMVGAVLTQNTAWTNVEQAIDNLKQITDLNSAALLLLPPRRLAEAIRPSGYFNIKAKRLLNLCRFLKTHPQLELLDDQALRQQLLSVNGIGPETADDILLYAYKRPVFVIDAYTRRLFGRLGLIDPNMPYEVFRQTLEQAMKADTQCYNEFHALIVVHAKTTCQPQPLCLECPLKGQCDYYAAAT
jgi:endonuclease-3 related protein